MPTMKPFTPTWVSPPGHTLRDWLEEQGMTKLEFAQSADLSLTLVKLLLIGAHEITEGIAQRIAQAGCGTVEFWLNREARYREGLARLAQKEGAIMHERRTFVAQFLNGDTTIDQIDDFIEEWHTGYSDGTALHDYLGLTWDQYKRWVQDPNSLRTILEEIAIADGIAVSPEDMADMDLAPMWGRCYDSVDVVFPANCMEKPEKLLGAPIGMYHCPDCGAMVLAGIPHPPLCKVCLERKHPGFDGNGGGACEPG